MTWLSWRLIRPQVSFAGAGVLALAVYLVVWGLLLRHDHHAVASCTSPSECNQALLALKARYDTELVLLNALLLALPGLVGAFLGAPVVARELESGTQRLIWAQSVTRRRWLIARVLSVVLACAAVTAAASVLLTWAASPLDGAESRFAVTAFDSRDLVPVGYAVFAATLGVCIGLVCRRTLAAVALTLTIFTAVQIAIPLLIRPHLITPVTRTLPFDRATTSGWPQTFLTAADGGERYVGYSIPGAWIISRSELLTSHGRSARVQRCIDARHTSSAVANCIAARHVHWSLRYQPASRFWLFQLIEFGGYLAVSLLLAALVWWRVPRVLG